ncbi:MAG: Zn-dependent hydrolase [Candidatus Competibacterales bacterium]|nr:Zn-dependent hydrolase [Candidatus Competibacterales bacterium]
MSTLNLRINAARLQDRLQRLGEIGALDGGGVCRLALTAEDKAGRDQVLGWMRELGLEVAIDRIGNLIGVRPGRRAGPPVMTGSHIDTVRTGGLYDGNLGVLAGLEVIETLNEAGIETEHPLAVGVFTNEEGSRFAPDMMGSLVYVGGMSVEEARSVEGIDGRQVGECLDEIGYAGETECGDPAVRAFVELHVEQGPVLEQERLTIGAVEQVQGISWTEFTIVGVSNHAGTTPMRMRHDAGYAAAAIACEVRRIAGELGGDQVGTVGAIDLVPNLVNVVANQARVTADLRNTDEQCLQRAESLLETFAERLAESEGIEIRSRRLARFEPVPFAEQVISRVEDTARTLGYPVRRMPSGAGHDAQMLARVCPAGMIFVPSVGGISHNVREYTLPEDVEAGANVLLHVLLDLAGDETA